MRETAPIIHVENIRPQSSRWKFSHIIIIRFETRIARREHESCGRNDKRDVNEEARQAHVIGVRLLAVSSR